MYKNVAISRRRANGRFAKQPLKLKTAKLPPAKRAQYLPFAPSNYSRGGRGRNVVQQPARDPAFMTDQITKSIEGKFHQFERLAFRNLNDVTKDISRDIRDLSRDSVRMDEFRTSARDRIVDLEKAVKGTETSINRTNDILAAFSFTPEQGNLIATIRDNETPQRDRRRALNELNRSLRAAFQNGLHDKRPEGGLFHNIASTKPIPQPMEAEAADPVSPPPPGDSEAIKQTDIPEPMETDAADPVPPPGDSEAIKQTDESEIRAAPRKPQSLRDAPPLKTPRRRELRNAPPLATPRNDPPIVGTVIAPFVGAQQSGQIVVTGKEPPSQIQRYAANDNFENRGKYRAVEGVKPEPADAPIETLDPTPALPRKPRPVTREQFNNIAGGEVQFKDDMLRED